MKYAGILTRSAGYPLDDPPAMVYAAVRDALRTLLQHNIEPIGAFEMALAETWDGTDKALRWEFTPDHSNTTTRQVTEQSSTPSSSSQTMHSGSSGVSK